MSAKILRPSSLHDTLLPMMGSSQAHPNRSFYTSAEVCYLDAGNVVSSDGVENAGPGSFALATPRPKIEQRRVQHEEAGRAKGCDYRQILRGADWQGNCSCLGCRVSTARM